MNEVPPSVAQQFFIGQRWLSVAELQLGLGMVLEVEHRRVTVIFPATGEMRTYASEDAPLNRVRFTIGDRVEDQQGRSWQVDEVSESENLLIYFCSNADEEIVLPEGRLNHFLQLNQPVDRLLNGQVDRNKWFELRSRARAVHTALQLSDVYGLAGCRTSLIPHQLYIAHEVSRRFAPRVLLADEVGLGKTIEAGLIIHQQLLQERAHRILIVVPDSLVHQWLVEMMRRFNLQFSIYNEQRFEVGSDETGEQVLDVNPWHDEQLVICSLSFLINNPRLAAMAEDGDWDMLVVDEAHHLEWSVDSVSDEYRLVESLAEQVPGVLLLTATPEQLGKEGHFARLRLLDPSRFPDLDHFLSEESAYQDLAKQAELLLAEDPQSDRLNDLLDQHGTGRVLFRNTRQVVEGFAERRVNAVSLETMDDELPWLAEFLLAKRERKVLVIMAAAEKALLFSDQLKKRFGIRAAAFHEGMSIVERDRAAAWFAEREAGAQVLLCSEIGSEGRNFQFAHHLVLLDLPENPDLLEQRIGRLDRIGQSATIQIHVPFPPASQQAFLYHWYHEGLDAFQKPNIAGHQVAMQLRDRLRFHLDNPDADWQSMLADTRDLNHQLSTALQQGRDRLLEMNSCRAEIAEDLVDQALQREYELDCFPFMERMYDCYGINSDIKGADLWVLRPGDNMLGALPGLDEEGMTVTYNRQVALANEAVHFLSWEHPLVRNAVDSILSTEFGNTALVAMKYEGLNPGKLLLDCRFVIELADDHQVHGHRYFPDASISIVVDEQGRAHPISERLAGADKVLQRIDLDTAVKIVRSRQPQLAAMVKAAQGLADQQLPELVASARQNGAGVLGHEAERLRALQQVNPGVRDAEIEYFSDQLKLFESSLSNVRLRLDALRAIVVV